MAREAEVQDLTVQRVNVGLSAFISIPPVPGQIGVVLQYIGTGGTLEIAGGGMSFTATGTLPAKSASLLSNGSGYPIPAATSLTINGPAIFWLSSGGATTVVGVLRTLSQANFGQY